MKKLILFLLISYPLFSQSKLEVVFQTATINSLLNGVYEGELSMLKLKGNGDFGIGTFNQLDGEMLVLNGHVYKIKADGKVYPVPNSEKTPFATVTFFNADTVIDITQQTELKELQDLIDKSIPTRNIFYAVKVEGEFEFVKTRSVPAQQKPYIPLLEVVKNQPVFESDNIKGTIAGFRTPEFAAGVNVPGYHFHFIDDQRTFGGHVLDLRIKKAKISLDYTHSFSLSLPAAKDFYETDLRQNKKADLEKVEK